MRVWYDLRWPFWIANLLGGAAGVLHLYVRFLNNSQGEMYLPSGGVDFIYAGELFALAFVVVWLLTFTPLAVFGLFIRYVRKRTL
jgi:hypothetical protein